MTVSLVCLDMAGTTVADDGTVMRAFDAAMRAVGLEPDTARWGAAVEIVIDTMGQSKIEVFTRILGDRAAAERANLAFEAAYSDLVTNGDITEMPGAARVMTALRAAGIKVCLTTGFSAGTRDGILDALGWRDVADLALSPEDVGRGRPWPDLIWSAALRLQADSMSEVVVVGDTPSDVESGRRAGAGLVVGVLSGTGVAGQLVGAGADQVIPDITGLLALDGISAAAAREPIPSS